MMTKLIDYIRYRLAARHRKGHGVHSPFMYRMVVEVISPSRRPHEPHNSNQRLCQRFAQFCEQEGLTLYPIHSLHDIQHLPAGALAYVEYPHGSPDAQALWTHLQQHAHTRVSADMWSLGLVLTLPRLQRQHYTLA